jgi:hypothetical protein
VVRASDNSRIHPRTQGLRICSIDILSAQPPGVVYTVIIPQSFTAHQVHDKKYYRRFNFESVPMEDYEIRQTMNRFQKPNYEIQLKTSCGGPEGQKVSISFHVSIQNCSQLVGHEISSVLLVPNDLAMGHSASAGNEEIGGISYMRIPGDAPITAHPFRRYNIAFGGMSSWLSFRLLEARTFEAVVRIYDNFGFAAEEHATIDLYTNAGSVIDRYIRRREELY